MPGAITNQRFHIDLGSAIVIEKILYDNFHISGGVTNAGVKNFTFWGSNNAAAFADLTYGTDTGWTQLTTSQSIFDRHVDVDQKDPKYIVVTNTVAYRYYVFKFADNWGNTDYMGVRRIVLELGADPQLGVFENTEHCTTSGEDGLKCSHTNGVLTGRWTSPEYDLGTVKTARVWGDFRVDNADSSQYWDNVFPAGMTWNQLDLALKRWYEIFTSTVAAQLKATVYWGTVSGQLTHSADFFEIQSAEFSARYVQAVVEIIDTALDANLKLKTLNMKAAYYGKIKGGDASTVFV